MPSLFPRQLPVAAAPRYFLLPVHQVQEHVLPARGQRPVLNPVEAVVVLELVRVKYALERVFDVGVVGFFIEFEAFGVL